jgi:hexokinase
MGSSVLGVVFQSSKFLFRIDKLTGALYLGDLIRRILAQLVLDRLLFNGTPVEALDRADTFPTKYISEILG